MTKTSNELLGEQDKDVEDLKFQNGSHSTEESPHRSAKRKRSRTSETVHTIEAARECQLEFFGRIPAACQNCGAYSPAIRKWVIHGYTFASENPSPHSLELTFIQHLCLCSPLLNESKMILTLSLPSEIRVYKLPFLPWVKISGLQTSKSIQFVDFSELCNCVFLRKDTYMQSRFMLRDWAFFQYPAVAQSHTKWVQNLHNSDEVFVLFCREGASKIFAKALDIKKLLQNKLNGTTVVSALSVEAHGDQEVNFLLPRCVFPPAFNWKLLLLLFYYCPYSSSLKSWKDSQLSYVNDPYLVLHSWYTHVRGWNNDGCYFLLLLVSKKGFCKSKLKKI